MTINAGACLCALQQTLARSEWHLRRAANGVFREDDRRLQILILIDPAASIDVKGTSVILRLNHNQKVLLPVGVCWLNVTPSCEPRVQARDGTENAYKLLDRDWPDPTRFHLWVWYTLATQNRRITFVQLKQSSSPIAHMLACRLH